MPPLLRLTVPGLLAVLMAGCGDERQLPPDSRITVYADREEHLIRPVLDAFTEDAGVAVQLITESGRALTDRLAAEKHQATADVLLAKGIPHLWTAAEEDILRPTKSALLDERVPSALRDPEQQWMGLLVYGRAIAYDRRAIEPSALTGYADLGDDRWRGKLCLSAASEPDNRFLIAMLIAEHGVRPAELIVRGWMTNLAKPIFADDASLLQAIGAGECGLGIVNSDRVSRLKRDDPGTSIAFFWPPAESGGAYVNVVGAGVTRHASNPVAAHALLEWLASDEGQAALAGRNLEYTLRRDLEAVSRINIANAGYFLEDAGKLAERARYSR